MKKKILLTRPMLFISGSIGIVLLCSAIFIPALILDKGVKWYYYLITAIIILVVLINALFELEFAVVSEQGIKIYVFFFLIADIKWEKILTITEEKRKYGGTISSSLLDFNVLVIRTGLSQEPPLSGRNKRKPPWQIIASERNRRIIVDYWK